MFYLSFVVRPPLLQFIAAVALGVLREYPLTEEDANRLIMAARAHWFDDDEPQGDADAATAEGVAAEAAAVPDPMS